MILLPDLEIRRFLAGQPETDYRLLWARYGMLFVPQDMQNLKALPSGLLGPVSLIETTTDGN